MHCGKNVVRLRDHVMSGWQGWNRGGVQHLLYNTTGDERRSDGQQALFSKLRHSTGNIIPLDTRHVTLP